MLGAEVERPFECSEDVDWELSWMLLADEQLFHKHLVNCDRVAVLLFRMDQLLNCSIIDRQLLCLVVDELHQLGTIGNSV